MPLDGYGASYFENETETITRDLEAFAAARNRRHLHEIQWQESALLGWPECANTFFWGSRQWPGAKKTQQQIDSSVSIASHRFAAIINSSCFPSSAPWTRYYHPDEYLMRQRGVSEFYDALSRTVWSERYKASANFRRQNLQNCQSLGMLGNANLYIDELDPKLANGEHGLRYTAIPVGEIWYIIDHQGSVCGYFRGFCWTAKQIKSKWPDTFPQALQPALDRSSMEQFEIVQCVYLREDYDEQRIDDKGKRYLSRYISIPGRCILEEGGIRSFPLATMRYMIAPNEDYGRGPMQMVLPAAKTLNMMKSVFLTQGHLAGNPVYLTAENSNIELQRTPGYVNKGGLSDEGRKLVDILETGNIQITKEMMAAEKEIIDDAFLIRFFSLALKLEEAPNLTARQILELTEQRATLMAPIADGPHDEYMGNLIPRELDVLAWIDSGRGKNHRILPEMPQVLIEARKAGYSNTDYEVEYTNPMTRAMMAGENASYMQMIETLAEIARSSNDATVWDYLDNSKAVPGMAQNRGIRPSWISTPQRVAQLARQRAAAQAEENRIKSLPAEAANKKADAIVAKAQTGGNIGGTLSGVPQSQMPGIPSNPSGTPGMPGFGGRPGTSGMPAP